MAFHLLGFTGLRRLTEMGSYAVYGFFVLSGTAMGLRYGAADSMNLRTYASARIARLGPLYVLATVLTVVTWWPGLFRFLSNLVVVGALWPNGSVPVGGWSIGIELQFYVVLPILLLASRRSARWLWCGAAMALVIRFLWVSVAWRGDRLDLRWYYLLPSFLVFFLAGLAIASGRLSQQARQPRWYWTAVAVAGVGALLIDSGASFRQLLLGWQAVAYTVLVIGIVAAAARGSVSPIIGRIGELVGSWSYGVYLLHPLAYKAVIRLTSMPPLAVVVSSSIITILAAHVVHRFVELPAGRAIRSRLAPAPDNG